MKANELVIAAFGTSLTERGGWTELLSKKMSRCLGRSVRVVAVAKSGETSAWGVRNVGSVVAKNPDIVLVEFAANDAALHHFISLSRSVANMRSIVDAIRMKNRQVIVVFQAMNPVWGFRGWIRPFLDAYNDAHAALAAELGVGFVDHRPWWRMHSPDVIRQLIPDGLHPMPGRAAQAIAESTCWSRGEWAWSTPSKPLGSCTVTENRALVFLGPAPGFFSGLL